MSENEKKTVNFIITTLKELDEKRRYLVYGFLKGISCNQKEEVKQLDI